MSSIIISPYSKEWPGLFHRVRQELLCVFPSDAVAIEHIGSTSVPGLAAKPVIDVLLGAGTLADIESQIQPLDRLGYRYVSKYERELPMRRYFVKAPVFSLRIHLHAVERASLFWQEHLAFRDLLRANAELRLDYQSLKRALAREHAHDKAAYSSLKGTFIQVALAAATDGGNAIGLRDRVARP